MGAGARMAPAIRRAANCVTHPCRDDLRALLAAEHELMLTVLAADVFLALHGRLIS